MSKRNKIIYWISTLWLSLGMTSTGIVQLSRNEAEVTLFEGLGYPVYLLTMIGVLKLLGVLVVLVPKFPRLKEWAYAGFFFCMLGAIWSHIVMEHTLSVIAPPLLLLVLTIISWWMRPADRKLMLTQ